MSTPRIEFRVNCELVSLEEVKKMGVISRVSLIELSPGVWSYTEVMETKYADVVCGAGWEKGMSYETIGRYLNKEGKIVSEDDEDDSVDGMFDVVIFGLDHPEIAITSRRYGVSAYFIEASVHSCLGSGSENSVEIDFEGED